MAGLVLAAAALWWIRRTTGTPAGAPADTRRLGRNDPARNGPLSVAAVPAQKGDINVYLIGLGTVSPLVNVTVRSQISGRLVQVAFAEGQMVKPGDLLAVVDPRPYEVALEQAEGQLKQAQAQLKDAQIDNVRYAELAKQDSIAIQEVDKQVAMVAQDEGLVESSQSAVDSAKLNLDYCHITATVAGRIGLRNVDPGNYVTPGDPSGIATLTQVKPISVLFSLPEDDAPSVEDGLNSGAALPVEAFNRSQTVRLATGTLATVDNQVDPTTGTFRLRALFANEDGRLFSNQFVNVRMRLDVEHGVTVVPTSAIERGQQGTFVYVLGPERTVAARAVTLGPTEGEQVAVASGLKLGELVVTEGADRLKDGMKVVLRGAAPKGGSRRGTSEDAPAHGRDPAPQ